MNRTSVMNYEYDYNSDSSNSFLVISIREGDKLLNHEIEMICQNPASAFIPFYVRRENEKVSICYNITSKISLSQYLGRKRLTRKELLDMLRGITNGLLHYSNYFLQLSGFVINLDFIYINPATAEISLIYVPILQDSDTNEAYRWFLKDLIVNAVNIDDNARDNYLQRILSYLKDEEFSLSSFNSLIVELRNSEDQDEVVLEDRRSQLLQSVNKEVATVKTHKVDGHKSGGKDKRHYNKYILVIVLVQLMVILAASIISLLLALRNGVDLISIIGVFFIAAAVDFLAVKQLSERGRVQSKLCKEVDEKENESLYATPKKTRAVESITDFEQKFHSQPIVQKEVKSFDTILITDTPKEKHPYLESVGTNIVERVALNKDKFIIGRLGNMVDHILQGSTIGKLHAEIIHSEGSYYIRDLNSKNGTYINGIRLPSNKECEIRNNDIIRLSNLEYVFMLPELK